MIKFLFVLVFSLWILIIIGSAQLPECNYKTANLAMSPRIFAEQTIDGHKQAVLVTRFFHNKAGIFGSEVARCYFNALDPNFVYQSIGLFGLIFWLYLVYRLAVDKIVYLGVIFLVFPILPFMTLSPLILVYANKIFAIIGLLLFFNKKPLVKS